jgi:hypothetical protein
VRAGAEAEETVRGEPSSWRRVLHDPRVLVVLVLFLAAVLVAGTVLTVATFTADSENTASVGAGSLTFDLTPTGAIVDTTALRPGDTRSGQVQVANRKAAATFTLAFTGLGTGPLPGVLRLTVAQTTPTSKQLYNGVLANAPTLDLGRIAGGASVGLALTFAWPDASRAPELQGQSVPLVLQWNATT